MSSFRTIESLYTDGACSGNPGPGGWGVVVYFQDGSVCGDSAVMSPKLPIIGWSCKRPSKLPKFLAATGQTQPVALYTDSEYVKKGITDWVKGWKKKGWKTSQGKAVLNQDLWEALDTLNSKQVDWRYVRAHAGDVGNERCDAIARAFATGKSPTLRQPDVLEAFSSEATNGDSYEKLKSSDVSSNLLTTDLAMTDSTANSPTETNHNLSSEVRVIQLRNLIDILRIADDIATKGYLITSSELADLMDIHTSAVTSRGDNWVWRNWVVSRVRREGNQILWQLERVD